MKNLLTVAKFTFIEVYRSKLMVSLVFLAIGLILLSYVASEFAYGAPAKVALDVGYGVLSVSNLIISIFLGSTLLSKEIDQRTIYMIISRPISRSAFLMGKILGLSSVLIINSVILGSISIILYINYGGSFQTLFLWTLLFSFFEAFCVLLFAVLFSLITSSTLSVVYTLCVFIIGHAVNETSKLFFTKASPVTSSIVKVLNVVIPNFYRMNLKDFMIYQQNISLDYFLNTTFYTVTYALGLCFLMILIFRNKNLD